ncbi:MAG: hypothetical protein HKN05_13860 [Rhizobiales bacterium]|nr:hypothetical protein [Hyphomicrobiales bacterium]
MLEYPRSEFAQQERRYIIARRGHIVEHMEALEEEHKLLGDRLSALDSMEQLFEQTERQLEKVRTTQKRVNQKMADLVGEPAAAEDIPRRTQAVQALRRVDVADAG